ncbi:MAG: helicase HerA domain-containing protein [Candidatus Kapaibacterium sp.]
MNLHVGTTSDGRAFNIEADSFVTKACAIIGIRGSGKTYAAEKLAELIYDAGK